MKKFLKFLPYLILVFLIIIDQLVKWWVIKHPVFFELNSGFIFGMSKNWDLFFWISCIIIVSLFLYIFERPLVQVYSLFIVLAAALSNLIDRIFRGGVIDFWRINYFGTQLYFNLADLLLILGVFLYAWQISKENKY